jgi:tetratricopeptide (TPR) repeat protein
MKIMIQKQKRMKIKLNYVTVLAALFIGINVSAQKFTIQSMKMELEDLAKPDGDRDYESLMKWSEETKLNTKTSNSPQMWYYRGLTYLKVSTLNNELSKANPDAIYLAHDAFQNALMTDVKKRITEDSEANLLNVAIGLYNKGYTAYQAEEYQESYRNFEMAVPLMKYDIEGLLKRNNLTIEVLEQMMAFSAMNGGEHEKAKKALQVLVDKGTAEGSIYANLAKLQLKGGDTTAALMTIMTGKDINEADKTLINMELDIYLKQGRSKELIEKLNGAIADDPGNTIYYFARAISYEGLGENDKAAADYDKILEIDSEYYDASYNKGVMYLNRVAVIVEELDGVYKPSIIEKSEAEINIEYKKAIVEFENVFNNNEDMPLADKVVLAGTMKKIYARLEQMEKYAEMKSFIESN